jgi:hypothetical protein
MRPVIVTTEYRGVFYGYAENTSGDTIDLTNARMAIYWGTENGLFELASTGPTSQSKITAVVEISKQAQEAWDAFK